jgi:mono/diheme cytochrome c family protein
MRPWIAAAITVAAVMSLGYVHPFGNPRVEPAEGLGTLLQGAKMPVEAKAVLVTKCADCHSSERRWPVYARIAPGSWLIERDIVEARKKMDLSRWEQMPLINDFLKSRHRLSPAVTRSTSDNVKSNSQGMKRSGVALAPNSGKKTRPK